MSRTDDLDSHLLQRIVDLARLSPYRHPCVVHKAVMMAQSQRQAVRRSAKLGHL
jgi:hypothetical protein